jgi:hypothetical protein
VCLQAGATVRFSVFSSRPLLIGQHCPDTGTCTLVEGGQVLAPEQLNGCDCGCYVLHNIRGLSLFATSMPEEGSLQNLSFPAYPDDIRWTLAHECMLRCLQI